MLVVVNQPHTSFRIEGDIPVGILDYVCREYGKENIAVIDDGDELLDPHEMDFYKKAKAEETPGKNMRLFRRNLKMTQSELAEKARYNKAGSFQYGKRHPSHKQKNCEEACHHLQGFR